ncbi:hypothetical protein [Spongiactinospora sp. TRM90649]|uniref:hypothetical protein n=1 Tax=Spongiactinospora sp. TRM90649 TaxID=3031114 RepID=UPI0023F9637F|nr:hypothetical protein [Spongiactinospora sp. TRM90649]MDF5756379.1 hypothetical protein [Spongiactinospora sp. TRM90649]
MYQVEDDDEAALAIAALPKEALPHFRELIRLLELQPWAGNALYRSKQDGQIRTHAFGQQAEGLVFYLIMEEERRVVVLRVLWAG